MAISKGAKVNLIIRRQLQEKLFDAEPGWLGPKYLKGFFAESDLEKRFAMIQQARNGGSVTPAMGMQLRREVRNGNLTIDENCQVVKLEWLGNSWLVECSNGNIHQFNRIWLSTGTKFDVTTEPLLEEVFAAYPIPVINGLPVLDTCLRWRGCELFLMGGFAALQIRPTARNLSGALMACEKIVPAIARTKLYADSSQKRIVIPKLLNNEWGIFELIKVGYVNATQGFEGLSEMKLAVTTHLDCSSK